MTARQQSSLPFIAQAIGLEAQACTCGLATSHDLGKTIRNAEHMAKYFRKCAQDHYRKDIGVNLHRA